MCCSRVDSTPTRQSRPELSFALPMKRPGAARTPLRSLAEKRTPNKPSPGPPKFGASARCWASPTMISTPLAPNSEGAFSPPGPSSIGSITATLLVPNSAARSVSASTSSMRPKVFTCGNTIAASAGPAASAAALSAARSIKPDCGSTGTRINFTAVPSANVSSTSRSPGYRVSGTIAAVLPRPIRIAALIPSKIEVERS